MSPLGIPPETPDDRLRRIESVTDSALAQLGFEDLLVELLDRVRDLLGVDTAAVLLLEPGSDQLVATVARGIEEEIRQGVRVPLGRGFAGRVASEAQPVVLEHVGRGDVVNPLLHAKGIRSLLGVPLMAEGRVCGVLHVGTLTTRTFTAEDVELLQLVGDRVALATQAHLTSTERATAVALQRSLLPGRLPAIAGLDLAARYIPGDAGGVGGDWYDVFTLGSGSVFIVIGDVVGRGLRAAVVMGRLRSALRAYALESSDPAEVLARTDAKLQHFESGEMATILCAVLDPDYQRLVVSSAGHPAPLLVMPDQDAVLLDIVADPPIGVRPGLRRRSRVFDIEPGALLCFFTDGLIERRGEVLDAGFARLRKALVAGPAEEACAIVLSELIGGEVVTDDVAVLLARRRPDAEAAFEVVVPAVPAALSEVRAAVRRWMAGVGATPDETDDVLIAIGEACSNAVEHAYGARGGTVTLRLELDPPTVMAIVGDNGRWRPPRGQNRGRGTLLMESCSDEVTIAESPSGTTVTIAKRITGLGA